VLPKRLYSRDQVRELDRIAIEETGIPGLVLMRRAAEAACRTLLEVWPTVKQVSIFCGSGNNAGDGYLLAGLLAQRGLEVVVVQVGDPDKLGSDASAARDFCAQSPVSIIKPENLSDCGELVVDALLGTGFSGPIKEDYASAIQIINQSGKPVLSLDIPTGLCSNTGKAAVPCVRADLTVTFIACKTGLMTGDGPEYAGKVVLDLLGISDEVYDRVDSLVECLNLAELRKHLVRRKRNSHKGVYGRLLLIGSDSNMPGALLMTGESALRCGAGLVTLATRKENIPGIQARRPELMVQEVNDQADLLPLLEKADALVAGPGMGTNEWSRSLLAVVLKSNLPMVLDADALNIMAQCPEMRTNTEQCIITPHPGEAARLLDVTAKDVQENRLAAVVSLQKKLGCVVLLKGAGTLISAECQSGSISFLCPYGNPGMASAGMGDVLSGVIGSLLVQGYAPSLAARLGACLHSKAADICAEREGETGMLATDIIPVIRGLLNGLEEA